MNKSTYCLNIIESLEVQHSFVTNAKLLTKSKISFITFLGHLMLMPAIRRNWCIATASNHIIIICVLFFLLRTKFGVSFECCSLWNSFPFSRNNRSKLNALYFRSVVVFTHQTSYYCYFICLNGRNFVFVDGNSI